MVTTHYTCDICDLMFETLEEAERCQNNHSNSFLEFGSNCPSIEEQLNYKRNTHLTDYHKKILHGIFNKVLVKFSFEDPENPELRDNLTYLTITEIFGQRAEIFFVREKNNHVPFDTVSLKVGKPA